MEYIKNNPDIDSGKKIIVCKPFRIRHQERARVEEGKTVSIEGEQMFRDRVSRQLQFRPVRRKQQESKALELGEIDDFMKTRVIDIKPSTAQTISLLSANSHKPIFAFASFNSVTIDPNKRLESRPRVNNTAIGHRPQQSSQSPAKRNDFKL